MEEYEIVVRNVTFILEAENVSEAKAEVADLLMDRAYDWGNMEVR